MIKLICGDGYIPNWEAISAMATTAGLLVALALPFLLSYLERREQIRVMVLESQGLLARLLIDFQFLATELTKVRVGLKSIKSATDHNLVFRMINGTKTEFPSRLDQLLTRFAIFQDEKVKQLLLGCTSEVSRFLTRQTQLSMFYTSPDITKAILRGDFPDHDHVHLVSDAEKHCELAMDAVEALVRQIDPTVSAVFGFRKWPA